MDIVEYELTGRHRYGEFAGTVRQILETVIAQAADYRVQQVQARAKAVPSLRKKLIDRDALESPTIEFVVKDLAGCRVVLYTNSDVDRFVSSGVIHDNFAVDWDRTKFHYPMDEPGAEDGFISMNYVVSLKAERLALPEYARFAGLACEVQVQTTLDHAWSEMAHDTVYKPPPAGFGGRLVANVKDRMGAIIQKYLRPAGFDFQKISADVRALERGRKLFEQGALETLRACKDNNERHDVLREFKSYVLPYYDDLAAIADDIRTTMVELILAARDAPTVPRTILGHAIDGAEPKYVIADALDVIEELRFLSIEAIDATWDALTQLYAGAGDDVRSLIVRSFANLATHQLQIWNQAGPVVERRLVDKLKGCDLGPGAPLRRVAILTLRLVLEPDLSGTTSTMNTVQIQQAGVPPTTAYLQVRKDAIALLKDLLLTSATEAEQREIIIALNNASRPSYHGAARDLLLATYTDTASIIDFMLRALEALPYEVLEPYEHDLLWMHRHTAELPPPFQTDEELEAARLALHERIEAVRDALNANLEFVIYKTLVGYQSVFALQWEGDPADFGDAAKYREQEVRRLAESVDDETFDVWLGRIRRCAQTKPNDGATFPSFRTFLVELGRHRPDLMVRVLDSLDEDLGWFVGSMLQGLDGGPQAGEIASHIEKWTDEGTYLRASLAYLTQAQSIDGALVRRAASAAIAASDLNSVALAMEVALLRGPDITDGLADVFADGLAWMSGRSATGWAQLVWFQQNLPALFEALPETARDGVLDNLVGVPRIDNGVERLVDAAAGGDSSKLLHFLHARLRREQAKGEPDFQALPYQFDRIKARLATVPGEVVASLRRWFDEDDYLFQYRAGVLAARVFPTFDALDGPLGELVAGGDKRDLAFVVELLRGFKGGAYLLPIVRQIVERIDEADPLQGTLNLILDETGVVSGEFGFVQAHQQHRALMDSWLTDPSLKVQAFAQRRQQQLDLAIAAEQRRAKEQLELRKRHWGEEN